MVFPALATIVEINIKRLFKYISPNFSKYLKNTTNVLYSTEKKFDNRVDYFILLKKFQNYAFSPLFNLYLTM